MTSLNAEMSFQDPLDASALITSCGHAFCVCIREWIESPESAAQNPETFGESDRPCPICRQKITRDTVFPIQHFEPTPEQLAKINGGNPQDDEAGNFESEMAEYLRKKNIKAIVETSKRGNGRKRSKAPAGTSRAAKRQVIKDSDDEDDFIDDSEENNPVAGYTRRTGGESDSEQESDDIESHTENDSDSEDSDDGDVREFTRANKEEITVLGLSSGIRDKYKVKSGRKFLPSAKLEAMVRIIRESPKEDKIM